MTSRPSGTSVKRDFVEAPSQIFENWMWNYDAFKLFARHYKTGELLPKDLFQKMLAAKNFGSGLAASGQVNLGILDMTLHDKYDPTGEKTTTDVVKEVYNKVMPYTFLDGTNMQAAFGHLVGYGAGYYSYMWSKVYAKICSRYLKKMVSWIAKPGCGIVLLYWLMEAQRMSLKW